MLIVVLELLRSRLVLGCMFELCPCGDDFGVGVGVHNGVNV